MSAKPSGEVASGHRSGQSAWTNLEQGLHDLLTHGSHPRNTPMENAHRGQGESSPYTVPKDGTQSGQSDQANRCSGFESGNAHRQFRYSPSQSDHMSTQSIRGQHTSLPHGQYCPQLPLVPESSREFDETALGAAFLELPSRAQNDVRHIIKKFDYSALVTRRDQSAFYISFSTRDTHPIKDALPPQAIQRVFYRNQFPADTNGIVEDATLTSDSDAGEVDTHDAILVTMDVPLSAPLNWKVSQRSQRQWCLLDEILHCPHPDDFPIQHRMWRLFHDIRRQSLVREYMAVDADPDQRKRPTFLGEFAELALYMFDVGRPPRIWTVGGEGTCDVGFTKESRSSFGGCMFTYDEADVLLLTEAEHVIWAAKHNAPKNVLIFDEAFNRRRPGKSTEEWLEECDLRAKIDPKTRIDVQVPGRMILMNDVAEEADLTDEEKVTEPAHIAALNLELAHALCLYREFQPDRPLSLENAPNNLLNITDQRVGYWPEGMAKYYHLLQDLLGELEQRRFEDPSDSRGTPSLGKPVIAERTSTDIEKCQQFRILAQRGAASSWHMDQNGVYTFIHLEANLKDGSDSVDDVIKYWPSYPMDHLSKDDREEALTEFAAQGTRWRPRPEGGIPVLTIPKGYMLLQKPGNIHAPITLTECFFLGGMAWKHDSVKRHLEVAEYTALNTGCTNEDLPSQLQKILLRLRPKVLQTPEAFGYNRSELEDFEKILKSLYSMVAECSCTTQCKQPQACACRRVNAYCGARCHKNCSRRKCANHDPDYDVVMGQATSVKNVE